MCTESSGGWYLIKLIRTSSSSRILFKHTMQELEVLRNTHSPTVKIVVEFCSGDEEVSIDIQVHSICAVQAGIIVDNVTP